MSRARRFADKGNLHSLVLNATDGSASDIGEKILLDGTDTSASNSGFTILLEDATGNADVEVTTYLDNGVFNFTTPPKNENHVMFRVTAPVNTSYISLADATYVQLTFTQVDYNIGGGWDASINSFKPPIAGYYQLQAQWHLNSEVDTQQMGIFWRRNESGSSSSDHGDEIARCPYSRHVNYYNNAAGGTDDFYASSIDSKIIMYFNGDTDFVNVRAYSANEDGQGVNIFEAPYNFWFSGQLVSRSPIGHAGLNAVT